MLIEKQGLALGQLHNSITRQKHSHSPELLLPIADNGLFSHIVSRILEFELHNEGSGDKYSTCEVELWDCAGDFK